MAENGTDPVKTALEAIRAALEVLKTKPEEEKAQARAGPLVVIGRFYVSLTLILAVATSGASVLDWKMYPHHPDFSITTLRFGVLIIVCLGLLLGAGLLVYLLRENSGLLFSPTELSAEAQRWIHGPKTKEEADIGAAPPPKPQMQPTDLTQSAEAPHSPKPKTKPEPPPPKS